MRAVRYVMLSFLKDLEGGGCIRLIRERELSASGEHRAQCSHPPPYTPNIANNTAIRVRDRNGQGAI